MAVVNPESAPNLAMGDGAIAVNSTALKHNSSPVPNNVNHEPLKRDSSSSVKKHHSSSSSLKNTSSPSVRKEHSSSPSKSHSKENSSSSHSSKSHHKYSSSEHKHSSKHKSSSSDHSKHSDHKHHSSSSSHKQRDSSLSSSAHKSKDSSRQSSSSKSNSSNKEHSSSSSKHHHSGVKSKEKRHSENGMKKENGIDTLPAKSASEPHVVVKTEPVHSPVKSESLSPLKIIVKKPKTEDSDDDMPLEKRLDSKPVKRHVDSDDDLPLSDRAAKLEKLGTSEVKCEKAVKKEVVAKKRKHNDDDYNTTQANKKKKKLTTLKSEKEKTGAQVKREKQQAEEQEKWRWWEEDRKDDGTKWKFLEHSGPMFAPPYEPLPDDITFYYDGEEMKLSENTEEVATFYARMLEHDYTTRDMFNRNYLKDWRKVMTLEEKQIITDLKKCNFTKMHVYFTRLSEERKNRTKEEKLTLKKENERLVEQYGYAKIDGHTEKIGNFRIEPPGLFRGRGDHPKQGMLKKRTLPENVIINCSKGANVPAPPKGHKWKEVRHDNTVSWLACWVENIQGSTKYVMLNAASKLKGEKDWQKYETARKLHRHVDRIRAQYREDWKSKEMRIRQRAVALYFIDKLALRAGNEKDEDQADTVGCCSLRVEHIKLHEKLDDKENVVEFDFLGKDSIRYYNQVSVEKRVFKNLLLFTDNKQGSDDVFDRLNTAILNKHLSSLMDGLTAKVFRTYNASITLQQQLDLLTVADDPIPAKLLSYNRANRAVAILCNHQRAVPKNFSKQMENLQAKIEAKQTAIKDAKKDVKAAKSDVKNLKTEKARSMYERKKKTVERLQEQLTKLEVQATDKDENKEIALGTSKLNYLDPRISVAWCKKWDVPIEKVYNKAQRDKFAWAVDMAESDFVF